MAHLSDSSSLHLTAAPCSQHHKKTCFLPTILSGLGLRQREARDIFLLYSEAVAIERLHLTGWNLRVELGDPQSEPIASITGCFQHSPEHSPQPFLLASFLAMRALCSWQLSTLCFLQDSCLMRCTDHTIQSQIPGMCSACFWGYSNFLSRFGVRSASLYNHWSGVVLFPWTQSTQFLHASFIFPAPWQNSGHFSIPATFSEMFIFFQILFIKTELLYHLQWLWG